MSTKINLEEFEEYTEQEVEYIDKYKQISGKLMEDEELYDIIIKYNFDDERIMSEVQNHLQLLKKKGDDYTWGVVSKGKKQKQVEEIKNTNEVTNSYKNKNYNRNSRYEKYQNQQQDFSDNQNLYDYRQQTNRGRGNRGNRRGRGGRGNRGGRRNFEENHDNINNQFGNEVPSQIENKVETVIIEPIVTQNEFKPSENFLDVQDETTKEISVPTNKETTSLVDNLITNNVVTPLNDINNITPNPTNEIQNVESFFQKFTLEKENEVNRLLEEQKLARDINSKQFYEECLNYFVRDNQIEAGCSFNYKPLIKPMKNSINSQPQLNYSQPINTQTNIPSTNKSFPTKPTVNQTPESYYGENPMMNMYPMMYPQTPSDSNMTNPQFFPQMMTPQMMFLMSQMYQQQMQSQMQDPAYIELMKGQTNKMYGYPPRDNMSNYMNQNYFNHGNQGENPNYYNYDMKSQMPKNNDLSGDHSQNPNYYYFAKK